MPFFVSFIQHFYKMGVLERSLEEKGSETIGGSQLMPVFYTVKEVAHIFRRHPRTIYRWIDERFLIATKVRDGWLITREEVERILSEADTQIEDRAT